MEFDPRNVNGYTFEQLQNFYKQGITYAQFQQCGLNWQMQGMLKEWISTNEELENEFKSACDANSVLSFATFVEKFKENGNAVKYVELANMRKDFLTASNNKSVETYEWFISKYRAKDFALEFIGQAEMQKEILIGRIKQVLDTLLNDMKIAPWKYTSDIMTFLFNGVGEDQMEMIKANNEIDPVIRNFIISGRHLQYQDLIDNNIIPKEVTQKDICTPDYRMPQKQVKDLGTFPTDRTDVYFLGVPRSGKSSVLSGIMYKLYTKGQAAYEPHFVDGIDPCASYYKGLIKAMASKKPPMGTPKDSISFMKLNIRNGNRRNEVTIVEMSGEAFRSITVGNESAESKARWKELGATQCLNVPNRKCLFFVIDYSVVRALDGAYCSNIDQAMMLNDALTVFCYDGPDSKKPHVGCTMSKVDTVAIIMTKCDLMEGITDRSGRLDEAEKYIENNFAAFANDLAAACNKFGINKANNCMPYILTFSLGDFYVGNTVVFNDNDSDEIIKFISSVTKSVKNDKTNFLGF